MLPRDDIVAAEASIPSRLPLPVAKSGHTARTNGLGDAARDGVCDCIRGGRAQCIHIGV